MNENYVPIGKLSAQPPPFDFSSTTINTPKVQPIAVVRTEALKTALALVGDRTTEEVLQAAHWLATGYITSIEEGDTDEDED